MAFLNSRAFRGGRAREIPRERFAVRALAKKRKRGAGSANEKANLKKPKAKSQEHYQNTYQKPMDKSPQSRKKKESERNTPKNRVF
jgi:hypothetical protein